jgi:ADP-ribosyl-[dinitrogen reductase] hydrolase
VRKQETWKATERTVVQQPTDPGSSSRLLVAGKALLLVFTSFFFLSQVWYLPNSPLTMRLFRSTRSAVPGAASLAMGSGADHRPATVPTRVVIESALWAFMAGDALSSPTHWFYGGLPQIRQHYGSRGIVGYTRPVLELPGSILNKSNLAGGGRTTPADKLHDPIIGRVINHGKQEYWDPARNIHYHATLQAGEPTLEAQLARVLMASMVANGGRFQADHFRDSYVRFMTTPGSHNDTYASTCHRMFFANLYYRKLPPTDCPDNDRHNVDTIDGLVLPTIAALAVAGRASGTLDEARRDAAATAAVTRRSEILNTYAAAWGQLVYRVVRDRVAPTVAVEEMRRELRLTKTSTNNLMTACYLDSAVPSLLSMIADFDNDSATTSTKADQTAFVWRALLRNANVGGENVHRGSCLGAILGAVVCEVGDELKTGLYPHDAIAADVRAFAAAVTAGDDDNKGGSSDMTDGTTSTTKRQEV